MRDIKNLPEINTAFILAGGRGKRMTSPSALPEELNRQGFDPAKMHKSMIPVKGKPLLEYTVFWLKKWGVKKIILGVGYLKESIINYFQDGQKWDINIKYVKHSPDGGTGDALKEDIEKSGIEEEYFFAMNSDQLTSFPLEELIRVHFSELNGKKPLATIGIVYPVFPFGKVEWDPETQKIINFQEKPVVNVPASAGIYLLSREILPYLKGDLEKYTFPDLVREGRIKGYLYQGDWDTINTIKDWERINKKIKNQINNQF